MARVLIIEDDPFLQRAYTTVSTMEGYETDAASDGLEGLRLAETNKPDLILLDMLMPTMNGLEFLRSYNVKKHPHTKVIVFSNVATPEDMKKAMELGATKYLAKSSFTPKEIARMIKENLAKESPNQ